jgi:hypothetical protein
MTTIEPSSPEAGARDAAIASRGPSPAPQGWWGCILDVALVLWILRVPVVTTVAGALLLGVTPQAQDLFTEFLDLSLWWRMLVFVAVLMVAWALPTHYAARMLVDTDPQAPGPRATRCLKWSAIGLPRLLGFLTFVIVEFAIWRSSANMPTLEQPEVGQGVRHALIVLAVLVAAGAVLYLIWIFYRPHRFRLTGLLGRLNAHLAGFWQMVSPGRVRGAANEVSRDIGRFVLAGLFVVFIIIFVLPGDPVARWFPRAMAVPLILGGWLPFLSYVSAVGRRIRAPLIVGLIVLVALLATVLGDNHLVRPVASANLAPVSLRDAVDLWMTENACNPQGRNDAPTCPRPIIVAAAGGASRAGFMMASTIGYFLDTDSVEAARYGVKGLSAKDVRNRLFAISSVSGGSMGAVMVAAALKAAPADSVGPPCANQPVAQWWGVVVNNWRDCFEALTSGDFLTADFFGLAFNDVLPFLPRDRAAVLEDSWRDRFHEVIPRAEKTADPASCQGLDCPFLSLQPRPGHWIPLLVLNGTSEATGGRILTTTLSMTYAPRSECPTAVAAAACPLFVGADRFHDLLKDDDVRLSTAAHNSARFPFISPPGSIRNHEGVLIDRIVDGGYFENYGALSAKELALAVHAVAPQLRPLVIVISNDPSDQLDPADDAEPQYGSSSPRPQANAHEVLTEATAPIMTFANTRTAHGLLAVDQLRTTLHAAIKDKDCKLVIQVRIWPDGDKQLSMSWWESPLVQRQIHRQTEQEESATAVRGLDQNQNGPRLKAIWEAMQASSCAAPKGGPA